MDRRIMVVTGSPRPGGYSTFLAGLAASRLEADGHRVDRVSLKDLEIRPCRACDSCRQENSRYCIIDDGMTGLYPMVTESDAVLLAGPVYWFSISAQMKLFIDRLYGLNNEETGVLRGKKIGVIFSYGDEDPAGSGVFNAIQSCRDMFRYTGSDLCAVLHRTERPERTPDSALESDIAGLAAALAG